LQTLKEYLLLGWNEHAKHIVHVACGVIMANLIVGALSKAEPPSNSPTQTSAKPAADIHNNRTFGY